MQNIDKKVTLILNLNKKLKKSLIDYWENSKPTPNKLLQGLQNQMAENALKNVELYTNVLRNLNYLNY